MKKIFSMYVIIIAVLVLISLFFASKYKEPFKINLPEKINVFFTSEKNAKEVEFEEYLVNVVAAEIPASFHEDAIRAQAVAARTYIYYNYKKYSENPDLYPAEHKGAVVCTDSTHCCAYSDKEALLGKYGQEWMDSYYEKIRKCVEETENEIIVFDGKPIVAAFHASSGGCRTENSEDVWSNKLPYLVSVESPGEDKREGYNSVVTLSCEEFKNKINAKFPEATLDDDRNTWFGDIVYTEGNAVDSIVIGKTKIHGTQIRSLFGLKSACFEISMLDDKVTFNVHGSGHGVGMSQYGANIMADDGKNYKEILTWYYRGTEIMK